MNVVKLAVIVFVLWIVAADPPGAAKVAKGVFGLIGDLASGIAEAVVALVS